MLGVFLLQKNLRCFVVADCFCLGGCWKLWKVEGYLFQLLGGGAFFLNFTPTLGNDPI